MLFFQKKNNSFFAKKKLGKNYMLFMIENVKQKLLFESCIGFFKKETIIRAYFC